MRSKNSIRNVTATVTCQIINTILSFLCRYIFIQLLSETYLGLSGLFSDVLYILSVAELGIGTAITFSMYKPLAQHNRKEIGALMSLYRRTYHIIGAIVSAVGVGLIPFIPGITRNPPVKYLILIYLMYVFNTVITYFFSYWQTIINADQKAYICTIYQYGFNIAQNIIQVLVLFLTRNFILYLLIQIICNFLMNLTLAFKAKKMYPYVIKYGREKLDASVRSEIVKNIKAMFLHRIGGAVVNGTDNILISTFFGLGNVAINFNYNLIINTLNNIITQIFNSITASVGNLGAVETDRKSYQVYKAVNFAGFWIYSFCSISLFCLLNPFILLWTRKSMLFPLLTVLLIVLNFYTYGMRQTTLMFKNAFGLFWYDRYKAIFEAAVNLAASLILAHFIGVSGIFLGTLISTLTVDFWVEPLVLFRHGFHHSVAPYFKRYIIYAMLTAINGLITWYCCSRVGGDSLLSFIAKCFICAVIPNLFYLVIFYRTKEFQYFKSIVKLPVLLKPKS